MEALRKPSLPDSAEILQSARDIVPVLRERSHAISKARQVPDDVIAMLADAGLMQLARPARYGGPDMGTDLIFNVARILAEGDGSTAWVYAVTNSHDHLVGLYPQAVQDRYWASAHPLCASSYQPSGKAVRVEGGYRLTGTWSFCSGIDHSGWIVVGCITGMLPGEKPAPDLRLFMIPKADLEVIDDWYVMGLAGTGSKSVSVNDLFIPDDYVLSNADVVRGETPGGLLHANPLYRASIWIMFGFSIMAPVTGILRGAYDAIVAEAKKKVLAGDPMFASRKLQVQVRLAEASALLESSELLYQSALRESAELIAAGRPISDEIRTRNRRNQAYMARSCRQAMDILMQVAGGRGIKEEGAVQRATRDLFAISAHPGGNWDAASASFGSVALGGAPTEMFC